ncbi:uncharacterized protein PG998_006588 [Apiospora kogelbergensis]|uniref:uncharacterized protein n=1 Tax=Apiospora kogelbergensis TaxID=1337665 RepID=UPI00312F5359
MSIQFREGTEADAGAVTSVFTDSFSDDAINQRVFPANSKQSQANVKEWLGAGLKDPHSRYMLAINDSLTGDDAVVALAKWVAPSAPPKAPEAADWPSKTDWPEGADAALGVEFFGTLEKKHKEHMGARPHWYLELLAVRKSYHGKGLGKQLLNWGLERADQDGVEAYLQASPAGAPLYRKCGFEDIESYHVSKVDYTEIFMKKTAPAKARRFPVRSHRIDVDSLSKQIL